MGRWGSEPDQVYRVSRAAVKLANRDRPIPARHDPLAAGDGGAGRRETARPFRAQGGAGACRAMGLACRGAAGAGGSGPGDRIVAWRPPYLCFCSRATADSS